MVGGIALVGLALLARRSVVTTGTLPAGLGPVSGEEGVADQLVLPAPSAPPQLLVDGVCVVRDVRYGRQSHELGDGLGGKRPVGEGVNGDRHTDHSGRARISCPPAWSRLAERL